MKPDVNKQLRELKCRPHPDVMSLFDLQCEVQLLRNQLEILLATCDEPQKIALDMGMTPTEQQIFILLHRRLGSTVSKESMMEWLYSHRLEAPEGKIVDVFICKMRRKMVNVPWHIETIFGIGYRLLNLEAQDPVSGD